MGMRKTVRPQLPAASAGILLLLLLVCAATSVDGLTSVYTPGPCPDGVAPGENWIPRTCVKCHCYSNGYSCYSCGLAFPEPLCYYTWPSPDEPYPSCCIVKNWCPGDDGYNATLVVEPPVPPS